MDREPVYQMLRRHAGDQKALYLALRSLPLDVVGDVMLHIPEEYHELRQALPSMASEEDQLNWTGSSGYTLLFQSSAFVRALASNFTELTGKKLNNSNILDFGCGWGRLIRLMYKYTPPENLYGCDPWNKSIEKCQENRVAAHLAVSAYLPDTLPFDGVKFDLIYSFSVYTHLSEHAIEKTLAACRKSISDQGLMAITIRPKAYWDYHVDTKDKVNRNAMKAAHDEIGFAHTGHVHRARADGSILYGDTSMTIDYIRQTWSEWSVVGYDVFLQDPFQTLVFLKPR